MPSTFLGLEIGRRALAASQVALDTVGHNTSNINTPGYSRQMVNFEATDPYTIPGLSNPLLGQLGTGATIGSITRVRDDFIDKRVFDANSDQGALNNLHDILNRVQEAYNEPGDGGIGGLMTKFFNSFADLSTAPESSALRATVRNNATTLASAFKVVDTTLSQINPEINAQIAVKVGNVNDIAKQIAELNKQIRLSVAVGDKPNDLMDKRGALLDSLSQLVDVQLTPAVNPDTGVATGELQVNVGGYALVQGDSVNALPSQMITANGTLGLITANNDTIPLRSGEIYGLIKATTLVTSYRSDLDTLASNLITAVNTQHTLGTDLNGNPGQPFFVGSSAASIGVAGTIQTSLDSIAASVRPVGSNSFARGNGDNARALAALAYTPIVGTFSLNDYYASRVSLVGADAQSFQTNADNQEKVLNQLKSQQSSVSGVSLDEELTRMLQYQRTYQAAARIINVMDETLDRIINGLGAGR